MTKKEILKSGVKLLVSFGVGTIVTNAVAFTTPVIAMGLFKKAAVSVGSFVLSAMVSDKATEYTDEKIDEVMEETQKFMADNEEDKEVVAE